MLKASVSGYVSFTKVWKESQHVNSGDLVFTIVPEQKTELIGKAMLPPERSGKVKAGQRVIRFVNYPDQEFGIVNGKVSAISAVPNADKYVVEIALPYGLRTNYKKELPFHPEMKAQTDSVTEDLRLIERIFTPSSSSLKRSSRNIDRLIPSKTKFLSLKFIYKIALLVNVRFLLTEISYNQTIVFANVGYC